MKKVTLLLIALVITLQIKATHIIGGQITSRCLGGLTQEVTLTLLRDIQGLPISPQTISYYANTQIFSVFRTVSPGTPTLINPTTEMYQFIDTITLPYIDSYTISNTNCCRPAFIVNIPNPASTPLYLETVVSVDTTCNSTPLLPVLSYGLLSVGTQFNYSLNATDIDGDSLVYSLVPPYESMSSPVSGFILPSNMTISNNGIINWTPTFSGTYSICVKVDEYRNGNLIGYVRREMQFNVGTFNGINEVKNTKDYEFQNNYDIIGRKIK